MTSIKTPALTAVTRYGDDLTRLGGEVSMPDMQTVSVKFRDLSAYFFARAAFVDTVNGAKLTLVAPDPLLGGGVAMPNPWAFTSPAAVAERLLNAKLSGLVDARVSPVGSSVLVLTNTADDAARLSTLLRSPIGETTMHYASNQARLNRSA